MSGGYSAHEPKQRRGGIYSRPGAVRFSGRGAGQPAAAHGAFPRSEFSAATAVGHAAGGLMGAAAAVVVVLWPGGTRNAAVQKQVAAFSDLQAVLFQVAACPRLEAHGLQLPLHDTDYDQRQHKADAEGERDPVQRHQKEHIPAADILIVAVVVIVIISAPGGLCDQPVALLRVGVEGGCVVAGGQIRPDLLPDIRNVFVRKYGDAIAAGGYVPVALLHTDQQQYAVLVFAVAVAAVVIDVVGIVLHRFASVRVLRGNDDDIHLLPYAQLIQLFLQSGFFAVGQQVCPVVHPGKLAVEARLCSGQCRGSHAQAKDKGKENR